MAASIGPAADGRIKPELSNYYDQIRTTSSASNTSYTDTFGGTSGATPITCGNAGLMFQMWADGVFAGAPGQNRDVFASRPHAATAKALIINSANQYAFTGESHDLTRVHQGWGTANVQNLYERARAGGWRLPVLVNETDLLSGVGQRRSYRITANTPGPLRATLVYTDPMGSPSAERARVNDLSLQVTAPDGRVFWGNNGLRAGNWSTAGGRPTRWTPWRTCSSNGRRLAPGSSRLSPTLSTPTATRRPPRPTPTSPLSSPPADAVVTGCSIGPGG